MFTQEGDQIKIHLLSDVHTEFADIIHSAPAEADVVVLAGDIGKGVAGIKWAKKSFLDKPVVYVAGNHEYYSGDISDIDKIRKTAETAGIHFLENDVAVIQGVRFLGCTLWSDINHWSRDKVARAKKLMNDYYYIKAKDWWNSEKNRQMAEKYLSGDNQQFDSYNMFDPVISYLLHKQSKFWLRQQLQMPFTGKTVVVTHHAPSYRSVENELNEKRQMLKHSYASDLEDLISEYSNVIDLWVHGHIHHAVDYQIRGVPIRSNPRGYPVFNPMGGDCPYGYESRLVLDI